MKIQGTKITVPAISGDLEYGYPIVNTISELSNVDVTKNDKVQILGYHSINDGGSGIFVWDATEDKANHNGGTIIDPSKTFPGDWSDQTALQAWFTGDGIGSGCWKRVYDGTVNVKWFGAKGDSVTDDTLAIQNAIDNGKTIVLESTQTYIISNALYIQNNKKITSSSSASFRLNKTTTNGALLNKTYVLDWNEYSTYDIANIDAVIIILEKTAATYAYDVIIERATIIGSGATESYGVYAPRTAENTHKVNVFNCNIGYFTHNTWKSSLDYSGISTTKTLMVFENDGSGNGTGTSCDIKLWHKGEGNAIYAYALVYSTFERIILEGCNAESSLIHLYNCYGITIESLGVESCTINDGNLLHIGGNMTAYVNSSYATGLILSSSTSYLLSVSENSSLDINIKISNFTVDDATALGRINNNSILLIDANTDDERLNTTKEFAVSDDSDVFYKNVGLFNKRIDYRRWYSKDGSGRTFEFVTSPPSSGIWKKGDKFYNFDLAKTENLGWIYNETEWQPFGFITDKGDNINLANLPTTDPGVAGQLWNDDGTVKVSTG